MHRDNLGDPIRLRRRTGGSTESSESLRGVITARAADSKLGGANDGH